MRDKASAPDAFWREGQHYRGQPPCPQQSIVQASAASKSSDQSPATFKASSAPLADRVLAAFSVWQLRKPLLNGRHVHGLAAGGLRFLPVFVRSPASLPDRSL